MNQAKKKKKKKKNALVICRDGKQFWTTQDQFWQWIRDRMIVKLSDGPLTGQFLQENVEYQVMISNTILNLRHPHHLREALDSRKKAFV